MAALPARLAQRPISLRMVIASRHAPSCAKHGQHSKPASPLEGCPQDGRSAASHHRLPLRGICNRHRAGLHVHGCGAAALRSAPPPQLRTVVGLPSFSQPALPAGTSHAVLETRGAAHYGQDEGGEQQQQQQSLRLSGGGSDAGQQQAGTQAQSAGPPKDSIHTLCTGNGSPYQVCGGRSSIGCRVLPNSSPATAPTACRSLQCPQPTHCCYDHRTTSCG